jgi:hypothetical protein
MPFRRFKHDPKAPFLGHTRFDASDYGL